MSNRYKLLKCKHCGYSNLWLTPRYLRDIRKKKSLTLSDVAILANVTIVYLSNIERGKARLTPKIQTIYKQIELSFK